MQRVLHSSIISHVNYTISNHFTLFFNSQFLFSVELICLYYLAVVFSPSPALFSLKHSISASQLVNKCILSLHPFSTLGQECIILMFYTRIHTSKPHLSTPSAISFQDLPQSSKSHLKVEMMKNDNSHPLPNSCYIPGSVFMLPTLDL